ncbi:hypothetical protein Ahy_A01g003170 [Arachis hypogaea]|uniref:NAD(P)H-quinone oxidoreductase subunit 5, chloroplastic n=1 Tax=Arachis hypogaea TaxID=3818 RepID=A0A445ESQ2_ARAHY|nr:hypothetical protein Ahy_A01g003170 [Arachis hypogaea]
MGKDTIADIMTSIRNADMNGRGTVLIPCTNITENIAKMFLREGFIENVRKHREWGNLFLVLTLPYRRNRKGSSKTLLFTLLVGVIGNSFSQEGTNLDILSKLLIPSIDLLHQNFQNSFDWFEFLTNATFSD